MMVINNETNIGREETSEPSIYKHLKLSKQVDEQIKQVRGSIYECNETYK